MTDSIALATLIKPLQSADILQKLLDVSQSLGLVTQSWESGDPTLSLYNSDASRWHDWESTVVAIASGGLLGLAQGDWLTSLLNYNYNVQRVPGTYATCQITLTNTTSASIGTINPGDITVANPTSKATYRNTTGGTLGPLGSISITVSAELVGSGGNSAIGTITQMVTNLAGVTCTNTTTATGLDQESDASATTRGQQKLFSLSPNGPAQAPAYVATTPSLQSDGSNATNVTRTRVIADSNTGNAAIFLAGSSGALLATDITKAQASIIALAEPLCVNILVLNTTNVSIPITYQLWVYDAINLTNAQIQAQVAAYLAAQFPAHPIGGDTLTPTATTGYVYVGWLQAQILAAVAPYGFRCVITSPAADVPLLITFNPTTLTGEGDVAVLGALTPTVTIIPTPH